MKKCLTLFGVALGLLAGCSSGSSDSKPSCGGPGSCAPGQFCAQTPDGNVCWPDTTPPAISASSMTCSASPCLRDSVLTVIATVADDSYGNAMGAVQVVFDELDPTHPRTLTRVSPTGNEYRLEVPLTDLAFPYFTHSVSASITAADEAGNKAQLKALTAIDVTRAKWSLSLPGPTGTFGLSTPTVASDGRIVLTGADGALHFVTKAGAEAAAPISIGSAVNGPPAIGAGAIWLAGQDGALRKRALADGVAIALTDCTFPGATPLIGPPLILGDRALVVSAGMNALVARSSNSCAPADLPSAARSPAAADSAGHVVVAVGSSLSQYVVTPVSTLSNAWPSVPAPSVGNVSEPLALDSENGIWTTAASGLVSRTTSVGLASQVSSAPSISSTGSIILSDGSAVIADNGGSVRRFMRDGTTPWTTNPVVVGQPRIPLALGGAEPSLLVPTSDGWVYVLKQSTGELLWSTKLGSPALQPANVWTEPSAKTSTAYLASANGMLYAVIVDGSLDTSAPWPKAYHDPQNTSNAATAF